MGYREKLYSVYVSGHANFLYGKATIGSIKKQFPAWKWYFGKFIPPDKEAKILDLGCGNGGFIYFLQSLGYKSAQGIDRSVEQVESARAMGIENVILADIKDFLSGKIEAYSLIFLRDVLEHFAKEEILDILALIYAALKKGGRIVIQAPNAESIFGSRYRYWEFTHEIAFTYGSLGSILVVSGFKEANFYATGPVPKGIFSAIRFLLWKIIELFLRFYMFIEIGQPKGFFTQNIIAVAVK